MGLSRDKQFLEFNAEKGILRLRSSRATRFAQDDTKANIRTFKQVYLTTLAPARVDLQKVSNDEFF